MPKAVSINPKGFVDDSLCDLSIDDVVVRFKNEERARRDVNDDPEERTVPINFRSRPAGLEMSIDEIHESIGTGEQILTRCMSRHAESWVGSLEIVKVIVPVYRIVRHSADGQVDVEGQLKRGNNFNFITNIPVGNSGVTSYSSIGRVRDYFSELAAPLGIPSYRLFLLGLCWSVTTTVCGLRGQSIKQYLLPEVERFKRHLQERLRQLEYFSDIISGRPK